MNASTTEKSTSYELNWSLSLDAPAQGDSARLLTLSYAVTAYEELYIADRLWVLDATRNRIPDPFEVYRFVQNDSLRLVFAQAPYPPNINLGNLFRPLYSKIDAGATRRKSIGLRVPVDEYSALARDIDAPATLEAVSRVFFVLGYRLRSTMDHDPAPPPRETAEDAGYVVYEPNLMISEMHVDQLPVKRRSGYIARFSLPGEPGPAPMPLVPS